MKVRVSLTVEIDPESWTLEYGDEGTAAIRKAVQEYCADAVRQQLDSVGVSA